MTYNLNPNATPQGRDRGISHDLSRAIAASLGKSGAYTRRCGLDHDTNKALLLAHLRGSPETGALLSELCQVLPAQSTSSAQSLFRELRSEGRVIYAVLARRHAGSRPPCGGQDAPVQ